MDDVTTILRKLRTSAGFSAPETPVGSAPVTPQEPVCPRPAPLMQELMRWAGSDPKRWKKLHNAMLRVYSPCWESVDDRDILVAWVAAWAALTNAESDLARARAIRPPLTQPERNNKSARVVDVNFWGRLASCLEASASSALLRDQDAARVLDAVLVAGRNDGES